MNNYIHFLKRMPLMYVNREMVTILQQNNEKYDNNIGDDDHSGSCDGDAVADISAIYCHCCVPLNKYVNCLFDLYKTNCTSITFTIIFKPFSSTFSLASKILHLFSPKYTCITVSKWTTVCFSSNSHNSCLNCVCILPSCCCC